VSRLGNLMESILLHPRRMSTVKIRARSLFRTPRSRIGPEGAVFGGQGPVISDRWPVAGKTDDGISLTDHWPLLFLILPQPSSRLHRLYTGPRVLTLAGSRPEGAKSNDRVFSGKVCLV